LLNFCVANDASWAGKNRSPLSVQSNIATLGMTSPT
jgi:hypothetical protein